MADAFVAEHPGVEVRLNLAGSTTLAAQILEGAPVDVFASADSATMAALRAAGATAGEPVNFAGNVLRIAVPPGNPLGLTGLGTNCFSDSARRRSRVGGLRTRPWPGPVSRRGRTPGSPMFGPSSRR